MTYPTAGIQWGAKETIGADRQIDRASNGTVRARMFYSTPKRTFDFVHQIDSADLATFKSFYATNLTTSFAFLWAGDGQTYTCIFATEPVYTPQAVGWTTVNVTLAQV